MFGEIFKSATIDPTRYVSIRFRWRVFGEFHEGSSLAAGKFQSAFAGECLESADKALIVVDAKGFNPLSLESVWRALGTLQVTALYEFQSAFAGECLERGKRWWDSHPNFKSFNPLSLESVWRVGGRTLQK